MSNETRKKRIARGIAKRIAKLHEKVQNGTATREERGRYAAIRGLMENMNLDTED